MRIYDLDRKWVARLIGELQAHCETKDMFWGAKGALHLFKDNHNVYYLELHKPDTSINYMITEPPLRAWRAVDRGLDVGFFWKELG